MFIEGIFLWTSKKLKERPERRTESSTERTREFTDTAQGHSFPFSSPLSFSSMASRLRLLLVSALLLGPLLSPQDKHASWICFMFSIASFFAFFSRSPWPYKQVEIQTTEESYWPGISWLTTAQWGRKQTQTRELFSREPLENPVVGNKLEGTLLWMSWGQSALPPPRSEI